MPISVLGLEFRGQCFRIRVLGLGLGLGLLMIRCFGCLTLTASRERATYSQYLVYNAVGKQLGNNKYSCDWNLAAVRGCLLKVKRKRKCNIRITSS